MTWLRCVCDMCGTWALTKRGLAWPGVAWQSLFHTFSYYERSDCVLTGMKSQPLCPDLHSLVCTSRFHQMRWCLWIWRQRRWNTSSTQSWLTMWCGTCASENVFASVRPFAPLKLNAEDISLLNRWDQQLLWVTKLDAAFLIFWRSTFPTMVCSLGVRKTSHLWHYMGTLVSGFCYFQCADTTLQ